MIHRRMFLQRLSVVALLASGLAGGVSFAAPLPQDGQRIVFLGDSITHGGSYIVYVETYLLTRFPNKRFEIVNLGLSSETTSGLSEPDHPFPRPCIHDRLDRALGESRPDVVVACYGMNDGIYHPPSAERLGAYRDGMNRLIAKAEGVGAEVVLMTPPVFDVTRKTTQVGIDAEVFGYKTPYEGYNDVLGEYAAWVRGRADRYRVAPIHEPMNALLAERREADAGYALSKDGVHPGGVGHLVMAMGVLEAWGVPTVVDRAVIDAESLKTETKRVSGLARTDSGGIAFEWRTRVPVPRDTDWDEPAVKHLKFQERLNDHRLVVKGLEGDGRFEIIEEGRKVGEASGSELAGGVNLADYPGLSSNQRGGALLKLVKQRQGLLHGAWLKHVGHLRADKSKAPPLEEALKEGESMEGAIRVLAKPVTLRLRLERLD